MSDVDLRGLGSFGPVAARQREPVAPPIPAKADVIVTPPPRTPLAAIFAGDRPEGTDALGTDTALPLLAEVILHKRTRGPLCIGLLGGSGTGKSFALGRLIGRARELAEAARQTTGPFEAAFHVERVDAATLQGDAALALAGRLHAGLRLTYPDLAREIEARARDPQVALRDSNDKLDDARRRLDSERRALDEAGARRARLVETVLYESAGSQVDSYARANRATIEGRLAAFGLSGDPARVYKDLVREAAGTGGRLRLGLASLWGYRGQLKRLVWAAIFALLGIGLGIAIETRGTWLADVRETAKLGAPLADWLDAHVALFGLVKNALYGLAALSVATNLYRAVTFLRPVLRGAELLDADLQNRRGDLDSLYAHQTKRVDALEADVERLTRAVAEAERRAGHDGALPVAEPSPFEISGDANQAQAIFASLAELMRDTTSRTPKRLLLAIDHLDALPPVRVLSLLDAIHRLSGEGLVCVIALDVARLTAHGATREDVERWIQIPLRVDLATTADGHAALVRQALGFSEGLSGPTDGTLRDRADPALSALDAPVSDEEAELIAGLATLMGGTPRRTRRLASLYHMARIGYERSPAVLAFMLAVMLAGSAEERDAVAGALIGDPNAPFDIVQATGRLRQAYMLMSQAGGRVIKSEAADAARRAALFSV